MLYLPYKKFRLAGYIYLIPVTLGGKDYPAVIPSGVVEITIRLRLFAVEDLRSARRYLRLVDRSFPIDETTFFELNEHTKEKEIASILKPVSDGNDIGIMSEAGLPGIADPGSLLVREAHNQNIRVIPLSGPSSILLALVASGMNGQNFTFHGYLPVKPDERISTLRSLEKKARTGETQIFMETPYRNQKLIDAMISTCHPDTLLCIAADISLPSEDIRMMRISQWKHDSTRYDDRPVVFLLGT